MSKRDIQIGDITVTSYGRADLSMLGENQFSVWCDYFSSQQPYRFCAGLVDRYHRIGADAQGDATHQGSCSFAMKQQKCAAFKRRALEVKLDAAIFYKPTGQQDEKPEPTKSVIKNESYWRGWNQVGLALGKKEHRETQPAQASRKTKQTNLYADAINAELETTT